MRVFAAVVCFVIWAFGPSAHAQIFPIHTSMEYEAASGYLPSVIIEGVDGGVYELTLEAGRGVKGSPPALTLSLRRFGIGDNILASPSDRPGSEMFVFSARDLANGPEKSAQGATRRYVVRDEKLAVRAIVFRAGVRKVPGSAPVAYALDELILDIDVSNLP